MSTGAKLAILISDTGTGTNMRAIAQGVKQGSISAEITVVISDRDSALGLKYAEENDIKTEICKNKQDLLPLLQKYHPNFICLAGWKQIVLDEVILAYPDKILNLHPGLIPDEMGGKVKNPDSTDALWNKGMLAEKAIQNFLDKGATYAGSSIHFLTLVFDFGPVLGRTFEKIEPTDTVETLYARLKKRENELYVDVLDKLCK